MSDTTLWKSFPLTFVNPTGVTDGTALSAEQTKQLKGQKDYRVFHESSTFYLQYNQTKEEFKNANIRKAISLAINRKDYLKVLGGENTAATSVTTNL